MKHNPGWLLRRLALWAGTRIHDEETGEELGRAFLFIWRGRLLLLGYTGSVPLRPVVQRSPPCAGARCMAFRAAARPDYPRQR